MSSESALDPHESLLNTLMELFEATPTVGVLEVDEPIEIVDGSELLRMVDLFPIWRFCFIVAWAKGLRFKFLLRRTDWWEG